MKKPYDNQAKLLIVEDNNDHWTLIQRTLDECLPDVSAHRVATAQQTLDQLHDWQYQEWEQPKLILLDLYLPGRVNGLRLLEAIKALPAPLKLIPIIIFSASEEKADILQAYEQGASSYLVKPPKLQDWTTLFEQLRIYWWETAALPRPGFSF